MNKNYFLCIAFVFIASGFLSAQVSGTVTDSDGAPLVGASIVKQGTNVGTTTDFDGNFTFDNAAVGDTLIVSYIGYETKTVLVDGSVINIVLTSGLALSEVIIVGSRNPNRTATESTVPVDVIDVKELANVSPQVNLNQILNYVAPSFTSNTQNYFRWYGSY